MLALIITLHTGTDLKLYILLFFWFFNNSFTHLLFPEWFPNINTSDRTKNRSKYYIPTGQGSRTANSHFSSA